MTKHYFRSDGNGGLNISKSFLSLIGVFLTLLTIVAAATAYSVGTKTGLDDLRNDFKDVKTTIEVNSDIIADNKIATKINDVRISSIEGDITDIKDDVSEIKIDIKELIKE